MEQASDQESENRVKALLLYAWALSLLPGFPCAGTPATIRGVSAPDFRVPGSTRKEKW
jgi:hypothetical protein